MFIEYLIMHGMGLIEEHGGEVFVCENEYGLVARDSLTLSECQWIVPGTVDPRDD